MASINSSEKKNDKCAAEVALAAAAVVTTVEGAGGERDMPNGSSMLTEDGWATAVASSASSDTTWRFNNTECSTAARIGALRKIDGRGDCKQQRQNGTKNSLGRSNTSVESF